MRDGDRRWGYIRWRGAGRLDPCIGRRIVLAAGSLDVARI